MRQGSLDEEKEEAECKEEHDDDHECAARGYLWLHSGRTSDLKSLSGSAAMQAALDLLAAETARAIGVPTIVRASAEPCPGCV